MDSRKIKIDPKEGMSVGEAFYSTRREFKKAGFLSFSSDAETLFSHLLQKKRNEIYLERDEKLTEKQILQLKDMVNKRLKHIPIQYITNEQSFMGLDFYTEKNVLIPRPETEVLVEKVIELIKSRKTNAQLKIVDIGTGSGVIAVSLACFLENVIIFATDISINAINLARRNAIKHHCSKKIIFSEGDLFDAFKHKISPESIDAILTNPPYIPKQEIISLAREIKEFEPHSALDGGLEGLEYFSKIIQRSPDYLKKDGFLAMEMGKGQAKKIETMLKNSQKFKRDIWIIKDYLDIERVIIAFKK